VVLSLLVGVRTEEARAITWDEVDLKAGTVAVHRSARVKGDTKTRKSRHVLKLPTKSGSGTPPAPRPPGRGTARSGGDVAGARSRVLPRGRHAAGSLARKEGVPEDHQAARPGGEWTPRELRHSFVSILSAHDVRLENISDLVGHTSISVTETVYRHEIRPALTDNATAVNRTPDGERHRAGLPCSGKAIGSPIGSRKLNPKTCLTSRDGGI
jgi:integrase